MIEYEAARFLGVTVHSLKYLVYNGRIKVQKTDNGHRIYDDDELNRYLYGRDPRGGRSVRWDINFDIVHGPRAYRKLLALLENPLATYEFIGNKFDGVKKQRVEQWCHELPPLKRRILRSRKNLRRKLFSDELFRVFYLIARNYFSIDDVEVTRRKGKFNYFRIRTVNLRGKKVLLQKATKLKYLEEKRDGKVYRCCYNKAYLIWGAKEPSDYVFYLLRPNRFLFMPRSETPVRETTFIDSERSKYHKYLNNFNALEDGKPPDENISLLAENQTTTSTPSPYPIS